MKEYRLKYSGFAFADIEHLANFAADMHTVDSARRYIARLRVEVERLAYLADLLPKSKYRLPKLYHPDAKTLIVGKKETDGNIPN